MILGDELHRNKFSSQLKPNGFRRRLCVSCSVHILRAQFRIRTQGLCCFLRCLLEKHILLATMTLANAHDTTKVEVFKCSGRFDKILHSHGTDGHFGTLNSH